jgi:hypothetical protein
LYSNELTRLCAREDYIESCRRESFKIYEAVLSWVAGVRETRNALKLFV